ncbi:MAG: DUF4190 domain-containing protein [Acidimicrobiales bacterium]
MNNKKATWALITGILSLFCFGIILGPVAIVLANQAKNEIRASGGTQGGDGLATAGMVLGIIGLIATLGAGCVLLNR